MPKVVRLTGIGGSRIGMHDIMSSRVSTVGSHPSCDLVLKDQLILHATPKSGRPLNAGLSNRLTRKPPCLSTVKRLLHRGDSTMAIW